MIPKYLPALCVLVAAGVCLAAGPYDAAFIPESEYDQSFYVTPNGDASYVAPMVLKMIGAGDPVMGGGQYAKAGVQVGFFYTRWTEGASDDYRYYVTKGPEYRSMFLPPDVTSLSQLPSIVTSSLPAWARPSEMPTTIAGLEWARYYNLPVSFQMQCIQTHGGDISDQLYDLDLHFETLGKDQCMWDVSDICDPDDDPTTLDNAGAGWGNFTFATPTLADPVLGAQMGYDLQYKAYVKRNLQAGMEQLLEIASHPRYAGRIAGFAIDPEIHFPAHDNGTPIPRHADYGGGTVVRPFYEDYHPVMCRQFAYYLRDRYGDTTPVADTNGDGVTFWVDFGTDYTSSGGFGHDHSVAPATWEAVDPPRKYPPTKYTTRTRYWQEWTNFRVEVINDFVDELVIWAIEAGVPATRMFTHQTMATSSYNSNRAQWDNADWLDDWMHMETPWGYSGISQYQPYGVNGYGNGNYWYENLRRRDESWGAPEYNPMVIGPGGPWATASEIRNCVRTAWDKRGHILWAHAWGNSDYPVFDCYTTVWNRDDVTRGLEGWTLVNLDPQSGTQTRLIATTTGNSYMESPTISLNASEYQFLVPIMHPVLYGQQVGDLRVDFQKQGDPTWRTVTVTALQSGPWGTRPFPIDMTTNPNWTGTVTKLRFHPVPTANSTVLLDRLVAGRANAFTSELASLLADKKDTPRPDLASPVDVVTPLLLADSISPLSATGNFVFYGLDSDGDLNAANTFFYKSTVACGGVSKEAMVARAPNLLGMRKTGKWRGLRLPANSEIELSFSIGIRDGYTSTDGARFRVYLRDEARELHTLFLEEWRWNQWSPTYAVDLTSYTGQTVNLFFETQSISDATGDEAVWGEPTITAQPMMPELRITNSSGQMAAQFDSAGNLTLEGILTENAEPAAVGGSQVLVKTQGGSVIAAFDADGNLVLAGSVYDSQGLLDPPPGSFRIEDDAGMVVAYISPTGDLYLLGTVTTGP